jgi:predicted nucleotidyltransferase
MDHLDKRWGVAAAWLFGSQTRVPRPGSDIDLAVLFQNRPEPIELLEARADLERLADHIVESRLGDLQALAAAVAARFGV